MQITIVLKGVNALRLGEKKTKNEKTAGKCSQRPLLWSCKPFYCFRLSLYPHLPSRLPHTGCLKIWYYIIITAEYNEKQGIIWSLQQKIFEKNNKTASQYTCNKFPTMHGSAPLKQRSASLNGVSQHNTFSSLRYYSSKSC